VRRALLLAGVALLAAGCGSSSPDLGAGAAGVPADAQAFVAVRTDDPNWRLFARAVLGRVPPVPKGARDLEIALVDGKLVHPRASAARPLADTLAYRDARAAMPDGLHGLAYVRGDVAAARLHELPGLIAVTTNPVRFRTVPHPRGRAVIASLRYRWGAAWLTEDGIGARAHTAGLPVSTSIAARGIEQLATPYAPRLFDEIPADARMVLDLPLAPGTFELLPALPPQLTRLVPNVPPLELSASLDTILQGESAVYERQGGEITIVTSPQDTAAAKRVLAQLFPHRGLHVATLGGQLVISTTAAGLAVFRGAGEKLSSRLDLPAAVTLAAYTPRFTAWGGIQDNDPILTLRFNRRSG
jgi:hypothetical protein